MKKYISFRLALAVFVGLGTASSHAHAIWQVWEDWEQGTAPLFGGVQGSGTQLTHPTFPFSPTHFNYLRTTGQPVAWWSVGRTMTPPAGRACNVWAMVAGAGEFNLAPVKLEVIDGTSWAYLFNGPTKDVKINERWSWLSGTFRSNGNPIVARVVLASVTRGSSVYVDDIVVRCK